jgi:hypothetical protein
VRVKNAMSSWMIKTEKKIDEITVKVDKGFMQVVEASGIENEFPDDAPIETRPVEIVQPSGNEEKSEKMDWKKKFTGIFKIKKENEGTTIT